MSRIGEKERGGRGGGGDHIMHGRSGMTIDP